jgi:nucleotide-binding universal stress UspA family protein
LPVGSSRAQQRKCHAARRVDAENSLTMSRPDENTFSPSEEHGPDLGVRDNMPRTAVVVVGVDGSDTSWDAFSWACGEARRLSGRVVVVWVSDVLGNANLSAISSFAALATSDLVEAQTQIEADLKERLRDELRTANCHGMDLTFVHSHGDVATELLRVATTYAAQLIVVGRSTKVRHRVAGALGPRLVRKSDAPVVVIVP